MAISLSYFESFVFLFFFFQHITIRKNEKQYEKKKFIYFYNFTDFINKNKNFEEVRRKTIQRNNNRFKTGISSKFSFIIHFS